MAPGTVPAQHRDGIHEGAAGDPRCVPSVLSACSVMTRMGVTTAAVDAMGRRGSSALSLGLTPANRGTRLEPLCERAGNSSVL